MSSEDVDDLPSLKNVDLLPGSSGKAVLQFIRTPLSKAILEAQTVKEAGEAFDRAMADVGEFDLSDESKKVLKECLYADYGGAVEDILGS
jgi:hypothetical protein